MTRSTLPTLPKLRLLAPLALLSMVLTGRDVCAASSGAGAQVTLQGPRQVSVGGSIALVAQGTPAGGTYLWLFGGQVATGRSSAGPGSTAPASMSASGARARVRGLQASDSVGDIGVRVVYLVGGMEAEARIALTCVDGDLTTYRPQHGTGYGVFPRTPVAEADELDPLRGPGIRINGTGDTDPNGEDDLLELVVQVEPPGAGYRLLRSTGELSLWTTRDRQPGTLVPFIGGGGAATTGVLTAGNQTLWVEWSGVAQGAAELRMLPAGETHDVDRLRFTSFRSIVMALGGENQVPSNPVDPNHGTFVAGLDLYRAGYDVHMHDEDRVSPSGLGLVYNECETAIQDRAVIEVIAFGYSHGGGSTHDLLERMDANRFALGTFTIPFSSYVDGVENDSDQDLDMELRRPPGTGYHANHYQRGSFADFFLDGGPVPNSNPAPTGLDVETVPFGQGATHFIVDDYVQVTSFIHSNLLLRAQR